MSRHYWTADEIAELDRLRQQGTAAKLLAVHFGVTVVAVRVAACRYRLAPVPPEVALQNQREMNRPGMRKPYRRGRQSDEHRAKISAALRASPKNKAAGGARSAALRAHYANPENRRAIAAAVSNARMAWCPPAYRQMYRWLVISKNTPAAEAREMVFQQIDRDNAAELQRRSEQMRKRAEQMRTGGGRARISQPLGLAA